MALLHHLDLPRRRGARLTGNCAVASYLFLANPSGFCYPCSSGAKEFPVAVLSATR